jgi:hypothetical protein
MGTIGAISLAHYIGRNSRKKEFNQLQAIADDKAEETLTLWIGNAAAGTEDRELCRHFTQGING